MEDLQVDLNNILYQGRLSDINEQLGAVEKPHIEGLKVRIRVRSKKVGDAYSKEFFQAHKDRGSDANITSLEDSVGISHGDQGDLERICVDYYANLYTVASPSMERGEVEIKCLSGITNRLTETISHLFLVPPLGCMSWRLPLGVWIPEKHLAPMA